MLLRYFVYLLEIFFIIAQLFLAGKDASAYLLFNHSSNQLTLSRIANWHRDGMIIAFMFVLPLLYMSDHLWVYTLAGCVLGRLAVYDIAFNKWSSLPVEYLGTTSKFDKFFSKIYGVNGAIWKALTFFALFIALQFFIK